MNALAEKYGDKLNILAFPCNQVHNPALRRVEACKWKCAHTLAGARSEPRARLARAVSLTTLFLATRVRSSVTRPTRETTSS